MCLCESRERRGDLERERERRGDRERDRERSLRREVAFASLGRSAGSGADSAVSSAVSSVAKPSAPCCCCFNLRASFDACTHLPFSSFTISHLLERCAPWSGAVLPKYPDVFHATLTSPPFSTFSPLSETNEESNNKSSRQICESAPVRHTQGHTPTCMNYNSIKHTCEWRRGCRTCDA